MQEAEAYKAETIAEAESEVAVFKAVYEKYLSAPEITRKRLLIETMERILENSDRIIVAEPDSDVVKILNVDEPVRNTSSAIGAVEGSV